MAKPPLTWLQAFEAAARNESFKAAAEELNVSPSNISHQVRDLESFLGAPLFNRQHRKLKLTREGEVLLPGLRKGFQALREATALLDDRGDRFHVGAFPFLANEIITPALEDLRSQIGLKELRVFTHTRLEALEQVDPTDRLDLIIAYGSGPKSFPGLTAERLFELALLPVVGRSLSKPTTPQALLAMPLIRVLGPFSGWSLWCETHGLDENDLSFVVETDSYHAAMLAVERGEGACLAVAPFIQPWLKANRLQALPDLLAPIKDQAAFAVYPAHQSTSAKRARLIEWLHARLS